MLNHTSVAWYTRQYINEYWFRGEPEKRKKNKCWDDIKQTFTVSIHSHPHKKK